MHGWMLAHTGICLPTLWAFYYIVQLFTLFGHRWDLESRTLTRVQTAPYAAEVTGNSVVQLNGWTYVWSNMQHPYEGVWHRARLPQIIDSTS
jgi:hypothetical protein